jgi:hypothetical protein
MDFSVVLSPTNQEGRYTSGRLRMVPQRGRTLLSECNRMPPPPGELGPSRATPSTCYTPPSGIGAAPSTDFPGASWSAVLPGGALPADMLSGRDAKHPPAEHKMENDLAGQRSSLSRRNRGCLPPVWTVVSLGVVRDPGAQPVPVARMKRGSRTKTVGNHALHRRMRCL